MANTKRIKYTATTPDGQHTATRTSTRIYTHARWNKSPRCEHQRIVSFHGSESLAQKAAVIPDKTVQTGIVPVVQCN